MRFDPNPTIILLLHYRALPIIILFSYHINWEPEGSEGWRNPRTKGTVMLVVSLKGWILEMVDLGLI